MSEIPKGTAVNERTTVECPECKGQGSTPRAYGDERDRGRTFAICPTCHGDGRIIREAR